MIHMGDEFSRMDQNWRMPASEKYSDEFWAPHDEHVTQTLERGPRIPYLIKDSELQEFSKDAITKSLGKQSS